ncbi:MAG: prepilin-type N-terminal cleavage/methylation domain-containing protein [Terriglobales bacterium]|jgi:prepilin-type N-terminal cleavage/methylation domain-containing protein
MRRQKGFSLIELLIVVAVILIIAAIAIPNLMRARMSANEASAVASMRSIFTAEAAYMAQGWSNPGAIGFSTLLADLGSTTCSPPTSTSACQLDNALASASTAGTAKSGYYFTYAPVTNGVFNTGFTLHGDPVQRGATGQRSFFVDQTGIIRQSLTDIATSADAAIQ